METISSFFGGGKNGNYDRAIAIQLLAQFLTWFSSLCLST